MENEVRLCADANRQAVGKGCAPTMPFDLFWFTRRYFPPFIRYLFLRVIEGRVFSFFAAPPSSFFPPLYTLPFIRFRCWLNVLNRETTVNGFVEERRLFETVVSLPSLCLFIYIYKGKEMSDEFENRSGAVVDSKNERIFSSFFFFLNGLRKLVILFYVLWLVIRLLLSVSFFLS